MRIFSLFSCKFLKINYVNFLCYKIYSFQKSHNNNKPQKAIHVTHFIKSFVNIKYFYINYMIQIRFLMANPEWGFLYNKLKLKRFINYF